MDGGDVAAAVEAMTSALTPVLGQDWSAPAGSLQWSCWQTAEHIAHDLSAYAAQVVARPVAAYLPFDLVARPTASPPDLLDIIRASGALLGRALDGADPGMRAWHWGPTDTSGFAAMGVVEVLVHTWDITQGLGLDWRPPARLCAAAIGRLVGDAPAGDPVDVLLWATGRITLDAEHPRRISWTFRVALG